jgi:hypothetical protein
MIKEVQDDVNPKDAMTKSKKFTESFASKIEEVVSSFINSVRYGLLQPSGGLFAVMPIYGGLRRDFGLRGSPKFLPEIR